MSRDKHGCPYYQNGHCGIGSGGFPCSLSFPVPYTQCYPYKMEMAGKKKCPNCGHMWQSMADGLSALGLGGRVSVIGGDPLKCPRCGRNL